MTTSTLRPGQDTSSASLAISTIDTPSLGDRSYVVAYDGVAVVVDPQRDIDRVTSILDREGLRVSHVVETHIHNDYVTGGLELARRLDATYVVPAGYELAYAAQQVGDGDEFTAGAMTWRVVHTPGHTPQHVSYTVRVGSEPEQAVFTGGSMLYGSVGRPDLIGPHATDGLAHAQWHSVRRLADELPGDAGVFPTHGFGSFCSATATSGTSSTIAAQRIGNPALTLDEEEFVAELFDGLDAFPAYYAHMGPANQSGPSEVDLSLPTHADPGELRRRIDSGEWVVDLRSRTLFAQGHLRGTLSFDVDGNAVTYLGWLIPWGTPLTLLGASVEQVQGFQRELVRIGIDRPAAHATGAPADWAQDVGDVSSYRRATFGDLRRALDAQPRTLVLDARRRLEHRDGHVEGARHVPLHDLPSQLDAVAAWSREAAHVGIDPIVWVYCGTGFRAAVAASLLARAGVPVVHIDEDVARAQRAGLRWTIDAAPSGDHRLGPTLTV